MFKGVWILYLDALEFRFYLLNYRGVWILLLKVLGSLDLHLEILEFGGIKFKFRVKIQTSSNFMGIIFNLPIKKKR